MFEQEIDEVEKIFEKLKKKTKNDQKQLEDQKILIFEKIIKKLEKSPHLFS